MTKVTTIGLNGGNEGFSGHVFAMLVGAQRVTAWWDLYVYENIIQSFDRGWETYMLTAARLKQVIDSFSSNTWRKGGSGFGGATFAT